MLAGGRRVRGVDQVLALRPEDGDERVDISLSDRVDEGLDGFFGRGELPWE